MAKKTINIGVIDAETDPFEYELIPEPFIWGFYDGNTYEQFYIEGLQEDPTTDLIEYLCQLDGDWIIYAHNGGKFDFFYMLEHFGEDLKIINGRISQATLKYNKKIKFRDSFNIIPMPLSAYEKDTIDYNLMKREIRAKHFKKISEYLYKDCLYLHQLCFAFYEKFGAKLTIAGTAFQELKKTGYEIPHTSDFYDQQFREYYFGGRVQCFSVGDHKGKFLYVDINSAYPFAMLHNHPYKDEYHNTQKLPKEAGPWLAEIEAISNGCLPVRGEDGRLDFPNDEIIRTYKATGWEIIAGLDTGTLDIKKINRVYIFEDCRDFKEYILPLYEARKEAKKIGDKIADLFNKLLMNSAYGKFGQDGRKFEDFKLFNFGDMPDGDEWSLYCDTETGQSIYSKPAPKNTFYNVATAASITGFVRAYLWRHICASKNPIYCDTDSLMCEDFKGEIGKDLGQWGIEAELIEIYIAQKKMYAALTKDGKWKKASKGVKLEAEQIKTGVLTGENLTIERPAPAFSLKYGARFFDRTVNFQDIKNI